MQTFLQSLLLSITVIFGLAIATILLYEIIFWRNVKYYKKTLKALPNMNFCRSLNQIKDTEGRGFVWFLNDNEIKCIDSDGIYLWRLPPVCFMSPISYYYNIKAVKWLKKNVDVDNLPNWYDIKFKKTVTQ